MEVSVSDLMSWIEDGRIVACRNPQDPDDLAELHDAGVRLLINLTDQEHDPTALRDLSIEELHLPVADFTAPSQETLDQAIAALEAAQTEGRVAAVHCLAGLGRTGTVVAAWLVAQGMEPLAAITRIRQLRPGSIETRDQEEAILEFAGRRNAPL
jgi:atypical dual specificity phosphatase